MEWVKCIQEIVCGCSGKAGVDFYGQKIMGGILQSIEKIISTHFRLILLTKSIVHHISILTCT